jgi:hypothetical protein
VKFFGPTHPYPSPLHLCSAQIAPNPRLSSALHDFTKLVVHLDNGNPGLYYMYGWHSVSPRAQLAAGILVALSGMASAIFVVIANSWMNTPVGFKLLISRPNQTGSKGSYT